MSTTPKKYRLPFEAPIAEMEARLAELEARYATARTAQEPGSAAIAEQVRRLRRELAGLIRTIYANLNPWEIVLVSRCDGRPQTRDYLDLVFDRFVELHGDRALGDDKAVVTGMAHLGDEKVMFIGHQKGKTAAERVACNFGSSRCAWPRNSAYRS
jgi:acetyl-CoA carboxylase carboxyl transferase subunit alpha